MDWNAVAAVASVLAAISVTLTVVYLAIQIRKNTHATHSQTYHLATSALAEMAGIIGSNKELARIFRIGMTMIAGFFQPAIAGGCRKERSIAVADIKDSARDGSKPAVCGVAGTPCKVQGQELTPTSLYVPTSYASGFAPWRFVRQGFRSRWRAPAPAFYCIISPAEERCDRAVFNRGRPGSAR